MTACSRLPLIIRLLRHGPCLLFYYRIITPVERRDMHGGPVGNPPPAHCCTNRGLCAASAAERPPTGTNIVADGPC